MSRWWILGATLTVASLGVGGYVSAPHILRSQVSKRLPPDVHFRDVVVTWDQVTLHGVTFDRGWVRGSLDTVTSNHEGTRIIVSGGEVSVDLDLKPQDGQPSGEGSKRTVDASGLSLTVKKGSYTANIEEAYTQGSKVCFAHGALQSPVVTVEKGCVERNGSKVDLEKVVAPDVTFQGLVTGPIVATGVVLEPKTKHVTAKKVETEVTFEGQSFPVEATGVDAQKGEKEAVSASSIRTKHAWLAPDWTTLEDVKVTRSDKWEVQVGKSHMTVDPESLTFEGSESCATWIESLPKDLRSSPLDRLEMTGDASFKIQLRPKSSFSLKATCKAACKSLPDLRKPFTYTAYTSKQKPFSRVSGRLTKEWVPLGLMGDMPMAVVNMEDPGFQKHRGFIAQAFANSLTDNLKQGRFVRGGSTLTMQLAKNLWLNREKTLGRKAQEFFLAQALESCYQKDEILELYLNVVEFGPDVYGAAAGAQHWFKKAPMELEPEEAFWLASILPRPSRTAPPSDASLDRIRKLMKKLSDDGRIPDLIGESTEDETVPEDNTGWEANQ